MSLVENMERIGDSLAAHAMLLTYESVAALHCPRVTLAAQALLMTLSRLSTGVDDRQQQRAQSAMRARIAEMEAALTDTPPPRRALDDHVHSLMCAIDTIRECLADTPVEAGTETVLARATVQVEALRDRMWQVPSLHTCMQRAAAEVWWQASDAARSFSDEDPRPPPYTHTVPEHDPCPAATHRRGGAYGQDRP